MELNKNINVIENFFDLKLIENLNLIVKENLNNNVWKTNLVWQKDIVKSSSQVSILHFSNLYPNIQEQIINKYINLLPSLQNRQFAINLYLWHKFSYIPFHKDAHMYLASTVYLNGEWDRDWGGFFIYEEEDNYGAIKPRFNRCIINKNVNHGTSLTTADAPVRITLQVFAK